MDRDFAPYCLEKTRQAIYHLATGEHGLKERLRGAFLAFVALSPEKFPEGHARDIFAQFYDRMTAVKATGGEGHVHATLAAMSEDDAAQLVTLLFQLEAALVR